MIGTNSSGDSSNAANRIIGPSAPPMVAVAAASASGRPIQTASGSAIRVPNSPQIARNMLRNGRAITNPTSSSVPIPSNTMHAIRPLENENE